MTIKKSKPEGCKLSVVFIALYFFALFSGNLFAVEIWVSPNGSDTARGTRSEPLPEGGYSAFALSKETKALQVLDVRKDSIAEKIGLKKGDLILKAGNAPAESVKSMLANIVSPADIKLEVFRNGQTINLPK